MKKWDFIFDFRIREVEKDHLSFTDLGLLFFLAKSITDEEFMVKTQPELFKDFLYKDIIETVDTFHIEPKQMKRLLDKLNNAGYIKTQKIFGGYSIALTFKYFNSISPKQFNAPDNQKYFFLLKWSKMSKLAFENGQKCPSFNTYYLSNTKNNYIYNNINNLNTEEDIINNSNNINSEDDKKFNLLLPLFNKYPQFKTRLLKDIMLPSYFDCQKLIQAVDESYFLKNKIGIKFLIKNYDFALRGDYKGEDKQLLVSDAKDIGVQCDIFEPNYETRETVKALDNEQKKKILELREKAEAELRKDNKYYDFDTLSVEEQEELIEVYIESRF